MPGFDRTGPNGQGPITGRGLGRCNAPSNDRTEEDESRGGRGRGSGFAFGRGRGRGGRGFGRGWW